MHRRTSVFLFSLSVFSSFLMMMPAPLDAALVPCGRTTGDAAEMAPCTSCHIIVGGERLISWGLGIMTIIAVVVIVAMAVLYIVSAGNDGMMSSAKGGIKAALIGFAIMLSAWLIVMTVLRVFSASIPGLTVSPAGFSFSCNTTSSVNTAAPVSIVTGGRGTVVGTVTGASGSIAKASISAVASDADGSTHITLSGTPDFSQGPITIEVVIVAPVAMAQQKNFFAFFGISPAYSAGKKVTVLPETITSQADWEKGIDVTVDNSVPKGSVVNVKINQGSTTLQQTDILVGASAAEVIVYITNPAAPDPQMEFSIDRNETSPTEAVILDYHFWAPGREFEDKMLCNISIYDNKTKVTHALNSTYGAVKNQLTLSPLDYPSGAQASAACTIVGKLPSTRRSVSFAVVSERLEDFKLVTTLSTMGMTGVSRFYAQKLCDEEMGKNPSYAVCYWGTEEINKVGNGRPTAWIKADPASFSAGISSTLSWGTTGHVNSCILFRNEGGTLSNSSEGPSGTEIIAPSATSAYSLSCSGSGGTADLVTATATIITGGVSAAASASQTTTLSACVAMQYQFQCEMAKNGGYNALKISNGNIISITSIVDCDDQGGYTYMTASSPTGWKGWYTPADQACLQTAAVAASAATALITSAPSAPLPEMPTFSFNRATTPPTEAVVLDYYFWAPDRAAEEKMLCNISIYNRAKGQTQALNSTYGAVKNQITFSPRDYPSGAEVSAVCTTAKGSVRKSAEFAVVSERLESFASVTNSGRTGMTNVSRFYANKLCDDELGENPSYAVCYWGTEEIRRAGNVPANL